jgi:hypothetical protein
MAVHIPKFYSEKTAKGWNEMKGWLTTFDGNWAFRGQGDSAWDLETSLERAWRGVGRDVAERTVIAGYKRKAAGLRGKGHNPRDSLTLLAEMQHYGAPTRLQDWTKSFYVAAFFACEVERATKEAAIWALNLAWLKGAALRKIQKVKKDYGKLTIRDDLNSPRIVDQVVLNNVTQFVLPVTAFEMNERLGIQQGLFLCPGDVRRTFMENLHETDKADLPQKCLKFKLGTKFRAEVLADLRRMNISAATLFPGLDGFAKSLNTELFLLENDEPTFRKVRGGVEGALIYL